MVTGGNQVKPLARVTDCCCAVPKRVETVTSTACPSGGTVPEWRGVST